MNYFNYFSEIEETFIRRRGRNLFLSPKDWVLMESWNERGIPLHIVIRAINAVFDVFDKQAAITKGGTRPIGSLAYCNSEVEAQHAEWLASQVGKSAESASLESAESGGFSIDTVTAHIESGIDKLRAVGRPEIADDLRAAIGKLEHLRSEISNFEGGWEAIDAALNDIEKDLEFAMLTAWNSADAAAAEKFVGDQMAAYKSEMEPDAYQNTFSLMLIKRLREESGIPRLGLFYL